MGARQIPIDHQPARRAPFPDGPVVRVVADGENGSAFGVVEVAVPPGAALGDHDHGPSEVLLIPLTGRACLTETGDGAPSFELTPGTVTSIPAGCRVRLENPSEDEARLLVVLDPPDFARGFSAWPVVEVPA